MMAAGNTDTVTADYVHLNSVHAIMSDTVLWNSFETLNER